MPRAMAPHGETVKTNYNRPNKPISKPPRLSSSDGLQRTISDISFDLSKEAMEMNMKMNDVLAPISEVEDAKCECCGISEECTPEYIEKVRGKFSGKWICGLCSEAVKEEMEKNGGGKNMEAALDAHMHACVKFNKFGRAYPVLYQAEAMREMLKKKKDLNAKSNGTKTGGISRSSSCIPEFKLAK